MSNSTWGNVAEAIAKFAPILGNALPGVGTLIGAGVGLAASVAARALGVAPDPDSVMAAIAADPQASLKLKQAELDHEKDLATIGAQREATQLAFQQTQYLAEAQDRDSARKLAGQQPTDHTRQIITYLLITVTGVIIFMVFSGRAESIIKDTTAALTVGTLIGYVFNELKQVLAFWFGATQTGNATNTSVQQFAVTPGTVTAVPPTSKG